MSNESVASALTASTFNESKANTKMLVKEWITLDQNMKAMKKRKKEISEVLAPMMKQNNVDAYNLKEEGMGLKYRAQSQKASISKKMLIKSMAAFFENNPETAEEATAFILNARNTKVRDVLTGSVNQG
jgi:hypothetical protein